MDNEKTYLIRCKHIRRGRVCNKLICIIDENNIVSKWRGREIKVPVPTEIQIKCERCGQVTVIGRKKEIIENV